MTTTLPLAVLRWDGGTQPRAGLDEGTVADYAEAMGTGASFPAVLVFFDGTDYWLADGFHRAAAAERCQRTQLEADVRQGSRRDACLAAAGANAATHGLRRSNADKRRAVALLLGDEEWTRWSDREVARRCGVSPTFVGTLRAELSVHGGQMEAARQLVERAGVVYEMDTAGIGIGSPFQQAAQQFIGEFSSLGVILTPTSATFPPDFPLEDWKRFGKALADFLALAGENGLIPTKRTRGP